MSDTSDKMEQADSVQIKVEQIKPWSDTLTEEQKQELQRQYAQRLDDVKRQGVFGGKVCEHMVKLDVTSACSIVKVVRVASLGYAEKQISHPFPKGVWVFECGDCGELLVEVVTK